MKCNICVVGEAWGAEEAKHRTPFIGWMSRMLNPMLDEAGISRADCLLTNVFNLLYNGKTEIFCGPKRTAIPGYGPLTKGYVQEEFQPELDRLRAEITETQPNIIIAMGNAALWAFSGHAAISKYRGATFLSTHTVPGVKVLPTYHPAAVMRQYELRPTVVFDLMKAAREAEYPEVQRPKADIYIPETIEDLHDFQAKFIRDFLSIDIETSGNHITCIGFAPSSEVGLVIPFVGSRANRNYWNSATDERHAWGFVRGLVEAKDIKKLFQNGLYDVSFLWRAYGIMAANCEHDTMLLHHALQPEALKGLGYLGSIYTDHGPWKHLHTRGSTIKRDN